MVHNRRAQRKTLSNPFPSSAAAAGTGLSLMCVLLVLLLNVFHDHPFQSGVSSRFSVANCVMDVQ